MAPVGRASIRARPFERPMESDRLAVSYVIVIPRWRFLTLPLIAMHVLAVMYFDRLAGPAGPPLAGDALRACSISGTNGTAGSGGGAFR
jgi:hypothetical protein